MGHAVRRPSRMQATFGPCSVRKRHRRRCVEEAQRENQGSVPRLLAPNKFELRHRLVDTGKALSMATAKGQVFRVVSKN